MKRLRVDYIAKCDNRLGHIRQEKIELILRLEKLNELEEKELINRRNFGLRKYMNAEHRNKILDDAEELGYSHDGINELRNVSNDWNQDVVTNEVIDDFQNLEQYIKSQAPYKKSVLYKIGGGNDNKGGSESVN